MSGYICNPLPAFRKETHEVAEICLTGWRVDNSLDGDAEERQRQEKDKHPEEGFKDGIHG